MKKKFLFHRLFLLLILLFSFNSHLFSQNQDELAIEQDSTKAAQITFGVDLMSRYIWRGMGDRRRIENVCQADVIFPDTAINVGENVGVKFGEKFGENHGVSVRPEHCSSRSTCAVHCWTCALLEIKIRRLAAKKRRGKS